MSIRYFTQPELIHPDVICAWPGIGQVAVTVVETLRDGLGAELFAEVDPEPFFCPREVTVHRGLLESVVFPASRFYRARTGQRDIILFLGEAQPQEEVSTSDGSRIGYHLAQLVVGVAKTFNCRRIYTAGAAVTQIHHSTESRVWAVPNDVALTDELTRQENVIQLAGSAGDQSMGFIGGLNGLLIGVALQHGLPAVCLMGEVPYYVQSIPRSYPAAAKAILGVLVRLLGGTLDLTLLDPYIKRTENEIDTILESLFADARLAGFKNQIERLKRIRHTEMGPITDDEQMAMLQHIDDLFKADDGSHRRLI